MIIFGLAVMYNLIRKYFILSFFVFLFVRCAQILPLSGGEKDVQAPKITRQTPPDNALNFSGNSLSLELDEYVVLRDVQNQFIVTPRLKNFPEVKLKGKSLEIKWDEKLLPNRTYTFQFGNCIADLHEGNILQNTKVVFSTGNWIDSASLSGYVSDFLSGQPSGEVSVFLYENGEDSCMFKSRPDYFTKADKDGNYRIERIHPGSYKVVAMGDKNKNFIYDQSDEPVDMWYSENQNRIEITGNHTRNFFVFRELPSRFFVKKVIPAGFGKVLILFNRGLLSPRVEPLNSDREDCKFSFSAGGDSLKLFYNTNLPDTARFVVTGDEQGIEPSWKKSFRDTFTVIKQTQIKSKTNSGFEKWLESSMQYNLDSDSDWVDIHFGEYLIQADNSRIFFLASDTIQVNMSVVSGAFIRHKLTSSTKKNGRFVFYPGALKNHLNFMNDTLSLLFQYPDESAVSKLVVEFSQAKKRKGIVELVNERGALMRRCFVDDDADWKRKIIWKNIPPGNYSLRFIDDSDNNRKWTTGNLLQAHSPERIIFCPQKISLVAGWEFDLEWKME